MYWRDKAGKIHLITEMSKEYLINCKKMLERTDIRIETLRKPSNAYARVYSEQVSKHDYESSTEYCYTSSLEYYNICMELEKREQ